MDFNVVIVGGGIYGAGALLDLASREIPGLLLLERKKLASGTSSRSSKLIHGGLRYMEHVKHWGLVRKALSERSKLLELLPGVVRPLPFIIPNFFQKSSDGTLKAPKVPTWKLSMGLALYDRLGGFTSLLPRSRKVDSGELLRCAPYFKKEMIERELNSAFLYYDSQMLDDVIVRVAAAAAQRLGANVKEDSKVLSVRPIEEGFKIKTLHGSTQSEFTTRCVVNATGPWCNANLLAWNMTPQHCCVLDVGTHILFDSSAFPVKPDKCAASTLQNPDGRVVFFIPWYGQWLCGTTESVLKRTPAELTVPQSDIEYLLQTVETNLDFRDPKKFISETFAGIRTMPIDKDLSFNPNPLRSEWVQAPFDSPFYVKDTHESLKDISRETIVDENHPGLFTMYGGKYTTFRLESQALGNQVAHYLKIHSPSKTSLKETWHLEALQHEQPQLFQSSPTLRSMPF